MVLLDKNYERLRNTDKIYVHEQGLLHEAFSIFVWDMHGKLVLQQRSNGKYHSSGLWSDTCSGHPRYEERSEDAAHARLIYEMGFGCGLVFAFNFHYNKPVGNGFIENELDNVFIGRTDLSKSEIEEKINKIEVSAVKLLSLASLKKDVKRNPKDYSVWLKIIMQKYFNELRSAYEMLRTNSM